jgi:hypothetical protein
MDADDWARMSRPSGRIPPVGYARLPEIVTATCRLCDRAIGRGQRYVQDVAYFKATYLHYVCHRKEVARLVRVMRERALPPGEKNGSIK